MIEIACLPTTLEHVDSHFKLGATRQALTLHGFVVSVFDLLFADDNGRRRGRGWPRHLFATNDQFVVCDVLELFAADIEFDRVVGGNYVLRIDCETVQVLKHFCKMFLFRI